MGHRLLVQVVAASLALSGAVLGLGGCPGGGGGGGGDAESTTDGAGSQDGTADAPDPCGGDASLTISQQVPGDATVHCGTARPFDSDSGTVQFTRVKYGEKRDCFSGCFTSKLCAVEADGSSELFWAVWYDPSEAPEKLDQACPNLSADDTETHPDCEPPGLTHPITETEAFRTFAEEQKDGGRFASCFMRYDAERFGP